MGASPLPPVEWKGSYGSQGPMVMRIGSYGSAQGLSYIAGALLTFASMLMFVARLSFQKMPQRQRILQILHLTIDETSLVYTTALCLNKLLKGGR